MTNTYNTLNPLGSTSAKDLSDNASNFDEGMNSLSPSFYDRFMRRRETWAGMEKMVSDFLEAMGFEATHLVYVDGTPLTVLRPTQLIDRAGSVYKVKQPASFPVVLSGTWSTDQLLLVDVGDAALRSVLAASTGDTMIGSTRLDASVTSVGVRLDELEDDVVQTAKTEAEIVAKVAAGGKVVIQNGQHYLSQPLVCDYNPTVGYPGNPSIRYDISGETPGGTILSVSHSNFAAILKGSYPLTQNVAGLDRFGNMTIANPSFVTTPNTTGAGAHGPLIQTKSGTDIHNLTMIGLATGLTLDGVLSSTVQDVELLGCTTGLTHTNSLGVSGPNAMSYRRVKIINTTGFAAQIDSGSALNMSNLTIEVCGSDTNVQPLLIINSQTDSIAGVITLESPYFELNKGNADIFINHTNTYPLTVNIIGGLFARVSPTRYVNNHIAVSSTGGGKVTVNLIGCNFLSAFGYAPSTSRLFWVAGANCEVNYDESCVFSETTSLPRDKRYASVTSVQVAADGSNANGNGLFTCAKESTGTYLLTSTKKLAYDAFGYNASATISGFSTLPATTAISAVTRSLNDTQIRVVTYDAAGSAVDSHFTLFVSRFY